MNYCLYQLQFNTAVHFGGSDSALSLYQSEDHFRADTLFSSLCHTALQLEGTEGLNRLVGLAKRGELLLSDAMPWAGNRFFLPKPIFSPHAAPELPGDRRKALKKLAWLPVEQFDSYCDTLKTGSLFEGTALPFGVPMETAKASVPELGDATPYPVGLFQFQPGSGLYFLAGFQNLSDSKWLSCLIRALGLGGMGGKVSAGYGKFSVSDEICLNACSDAQAQWLYHALAQPAPSAMLLTTSLPTDDELDAALEGASYQLIRRAGFVASDTYSQTPRKKQTQFFLSAGSVLNHRFSGELYEIGFRGAHPVLRYSRPMFLGVAL